MMDDHETTEAEPTLVDLAERLDTEGMVGFTQRFHDDRQGFDAITRNATLVGRPAKGPVERSPVPRNGRQRSGR